jgi:hypothetical protein
MRDSAYEERTAPSGGVRRPANAALAAFLLIISPAACATAVQSGSIVGKVLTEGGDPVEAATVKLVADTAIVKEVVTDAAGEFSFPCIPPGSYRVWVIPPVTRDLVGDTLEAEASQVRHAVHADRVTSMERRLPQGGRLLVKFTRGGSTWSPDSGVFSLTLSSPAGRLDSPTALADGVIFGGLPPRDDYELVFEPEGFATQRVHNLSISPSASTTATVRYDPDDATGIVGILRMPDGSPLSDVLLSVRLQGQPLEASAGADKTDDEGRFSIVGLQPGTYVIDDVTTPELGTVVVEQGSRTQVELVWGQGRVASMDMRSQGDRRRCPQTHDRRHAEGLADPRGGGGPRRQPADGPAETRVGTTRGGAADRVGPRGRPPEGCDLPR